MILEIVSKHIEKLGEDPLIKSIELERIFCDIAGDNFLKCFLSDSIIKKQIEGLSIANYQITLIDSLLTRFLTPIFMIFGKKYHNNAFFGEAKRINVKCREYHQFINDEICFQKQLMNENKILKNDYKFIHHTLKSLETQSELKNSDIDLGYEFISLFADGIFVPSFTLLHSLMILSDYP